MSERLDSRWREYETAGKRQAAIHVDRAECHARPDGSWAVYGDYAVGKFCGRATEQSLHAAQVAVENQLRARGLL